MKKQSKKFYLKEQAQAMVDIAKFNLKEAAKRLKKLTTN